MKTYRMEELNKSIIEKHFNKNIQMDVITKRNAVYHIVKANTQSGEKYRIYSQYTMQSRPLTKELKKIFCA